MKTSSRTVRVFISSTFRDFAEERDLLVKKVFPELRRKCRERQVELVDVDLRWGITEKEAQQGKVLPICLAEIERARPFFIGLIGERYGWIPASDQYDPSILQEQPWLEEHRGGKSVTELEILHGVLNNPKMAGQAFFYFRDYKWAERKGGDYLADTEDEQEKLVALKERIRESQFPVVENYKNPQSLAERIKDDLWKIIDEAYPVDEVPDALTQERMVHEAYAETRRRLYLGGEGYIAKLNDAMKARDFRPVLITGQSGGGKSALLANWVTSWSKRNKKAAVIVHHLGAGSDAADPIRLAVRLMQEISRITGEVFKAESDPDKQLEKLPEWLAMVSSWAQRTKTELLIVLDGIDKVSERQHLRWFPRFLPPKVKLVASCLHGDILEEVKGHLNWQELMVKPFTKTEQKSFIGKYLGRYGKTLTTKQTKALQTHFLSGNPLFLLMVLEELRVFGVHTQLEKRLTELLSPPLSKTRGEAPSVDDIFEHVLVRMEKDFGRKAVQQSMETIWASRSGLFQDELLAIAKIPPAKLAAILNALDESLYESGGKINFGHDYLRKAVEDRYLATDPKLRAVHSRMSCFFSLQGNYLDDLRNIPNTRKITELPYQYLHSMSWELLVKTLTDFDLLMAACYASLHAQLLSDYASAFVALDQVGRRVLSIWWRFLKERSHLLHKADAHWGSHRILLQLACEHADTSPLTIAAEAWITKGYCNWDRLQAEVRPNTVPRNAVIARLERSPNKIIGIVPWGQDVLVGWTKHEIIVWNRHTGQITEIFSAPESTLLSASAANNSIVSAREGDTDVRLFTTLPLNKAKVLKMKSPVESLCTSGNYALIVCSDSFLRLDLADQNFSLSWVCAKPDEEEELFAASDDFFITMRLWRPLVRGNEPRYTWKIRNPKNALILCDVNALIDEDHAPSNFIFVLDGLLIFSKATLYENFQEWSKAVVIEPHGGVFCGTLQALRSDLSPEFARRIIIIASRPDLIISLEKNILVAWNTKGVTSRMILHATADENPRVIRHEVHRAGVKSVFFVDHQTAAVLTTEDNLIFWNLFDGTVRPAPSLPRKSQTLLGAANNWLLLGGTQRDDWDQGLDTKPKLIIALDCASNSLYNLCRFAHENRLTAVDDGDGKIVLFGEKEVLICDPSKGEPFGGSAEIISGIHCVSRCLIDDDKWLVLGQDQGMVWSPIAKSVTSFIECVSDTRGCGELRGDRLLLWDRQCELELGSYGNIFLLSNKSSGWIELQELNLCPESPAFDPWISHNVTSLGKLCVITQMSRVEIWRDMKELVECISDNRIRNEFWHCNGYLLIRLDDESPSNKIASNKAIMIEVHEETKVNAREVDLKCLGFKILLEPVNGLAFIEDHQGNLFAPFTEITETPANVLCLLPVKRSIDYTNSGGIYPCVCHHPDLGYVSVNFKGRQIRWYSMSEVKFARHIASPGGDAISWSLDYTPCLLGSVFFIDDSTEGFKQIKAIPYLPITFSSKNR